ncbi:MAG: response regulator [Desulfobacterales bacterium]|nr:response regulator [Desulfobacterales bacterium]
MKTILIADDDRVLRQRLVHALSKARGDLVLIEAGDGEVAVKALKDNAVGLVITDINMPKASGLVVLAYLNAFLPQVPCFVMTSYGTSRLKAKMPPDLLRFYQKPFDLQDMARSAVAVLERKVDPEACRGVALVHLLDLSMAEGVTCTIVVTGPEGIKCRLYLVDGQLWDAVIDDRRGEAAAVESLAWSRPEYCIDYIIPDSVEKNIHVSLDDLLRTVSLCPKTR